MTKKVSKLTKKISSLTILIFFISAQFSPLFAEQIELSDDELDQIHAGGLNLNFDNFYGNLGSTASQTPGTLTTTSGTNPIGANSGGNQTVTILSPLQPKSTTQPSSTVAPTTVITTSTPKSPLEVVNLNPVSIPTVVESAILPTTPSSPQESISIIEPISPAMPSGDPGLPVTIENSNLPTETFNPLAPVTAFAPETPTDTTIPTSSVNISATNFPIDTTSPAISATLESPIALTNSSTIPSTNEPAVDTSSTTVTNTPTTSTPEPQGMVFDIVASNGSNGNLAFSVNSNSDLTKFVSPTSVSTSSIGGQNSVNVSDTSQQALSALVNVNAAGSTIPVLLNLTIIMGDNLGTVTNTNDLNLSNYATFQVQ